MSTEEFRIVERIPSVPEYQSLRRVVGWSEPDAAAVETGLANALYSVCLMRGSEIVGCGRVIGDGGIYLYVQDIIVLPAYHGRGLGRLIMGVIMSFIERTARPKTFVGLMAAKDVAGFYERYGFTRRPDDRPGMFRVM